MACPRFYIGPTKLQTGRVTLPPDEAHHARASRRLRESDEVALFDGSGTDCRGKIISLANHELVVQVDEVRHRAFDTPVRLTLAVSFPKGPRQDFLVEKCTELGVSAIWPVTCRRSIAKPSAHRIEKLRRTAIEACKQAQRCWLPDITMPMTFAEVITRQDQFDTCLVADRDGRRSSTPHIENQRVLLLIGPEGGFASEELAAADSEGFSFVELGPIVLRTETAAIAGAVHLLLQRNS